jgi:hypothetical protein
VTQVIQEQSSSILNEGAAKPAQRSLWLAGNPGSGKTFLGDYLASRGWHHIDGNQGNKTEDAGVKERWAKLYQAMAEHQAGKTEINLCELARSVTPQYCGVTERLRLLMVTTDTRHYHPTMTAESLCHKNNKPLFLNQY